METTRIAVAGLALASVLTLWGCDRGDAGTPARTTSGSAGGIHATDHPAAPLIEGKPMWADNREHTAMENLDYQFQHWGEALGARDAKDYAKKARGFIDHPPHAVERVSRPNGDVMIYDKTANVMAIVRKDGAPRLFRKPVAGAADWEKAKADASSGGGRNRSRYHAPNGD